MEKLAAYGRLKVLLDDIDPDPKFQIKVDGEYQDISNEPGSSYMNFPMDRMLAYDGISLNHYNRQPGWLYAPEP